MENIVLTIGGFIKSLNWNDLFFLVSGIILILLMTYIVYLIRIDDSEKITSDIEEVIDTKEIKENKKKDTLIDIVNNLETNYEPQPIDLTKYEQEMENTAIISYEELLERTASNKIVYEDDYNSGTDEIVVKKVDPTNMSKTQELVDLPKAVMMDYGSEEAFLNALKVLDSNLVR